MTFPKTNVLNQFARTNTKLSSTKLVQDRGIQSLKKKGKVRLALLSLTNLYSQDTIAELSILPNNDLPNIDGATCNRNLNICSPGIIEEVKKHYLYSINYAITKTKADIICINELGFPSNEHGPLEEIRQHSADLAEEHNCVIIAGSYHDYRTMYNSGCLFFPQHDKLKRWYYHKQMSASHLSPPELVSIPPKRTTLFFEAFGLRVAILVCLDILDYATITSIVQTTDIDLLLVPSYSERTDTIKETAKFVSTAMSGKVALINYYNNADTTSFVYTFGQTTPLKEKELPNGHGKIYWHDINVEQFRDERIDQNARLSSELFWLFNIQPLESRAP